MARVLVVDDEPLIAMMAEDWLSEIGHETVGPANDLETAMALANSEIDAAIVDVTLGRDSGYEIAKLLTARDIPFAFATGRSIATKGDQYEAFSLLAKPFEFDAFRRTVEAMVGPGRR
jgi:DNA-binding response OmpR family regulator